MKLDTKYNVGSKYDFIVDVDLNHQEFIHLGIKLKDGTFDKRSNYVAVLMSKKNVKKLIEDLAQRYKMMDELEDEA